MRILKRDFAKKAWNYAIHWITDNILCSVFLLMPLRDVIIFESVPDCSDNTKAIFDEMVCRGLNKKYKLVWYLHGNNNNYPCIENVEYLENTRGRLVRNYYEYTARCLISANQFLVSHSKRQKSYYTTHGTSFKAVSSYYTMPSKINWLLTASEDAGKILAKELKVDLQKEVHLGFPRNDVFATTPKPIKHLFDTSYSKLIIWYPTFRQHKAGGHNSASKQGLPIIHNEKSAQQLNDYAREKGVLIVLKPHFAQDLAYVKALDLSNIIFIDDDFFVRNGITSYEFVNAADAMLTDYSSIYYDYLLCDKPVGLVWEDIEEYQKDPGFAVDLSVYCKGGEKIYTLEDLNEFIDNLVNGNDRLKKERREVCQMVNYSNDGRNSSRVVDFICKDANL